MQTGLKCRWSHESIDSSGSWFFPIIHESCECSIFGISRGKQKSRKYVKLEQETSIHHRLSAPTVNKNWISMIPDRNSSKETPSMLHNQPVSRLSGVCFDPSRCARLKTGNGLMSSNNVKSNSNQQPLCYETRFFSRKTSGLSPAAHIPV